MMAELYNTEVYSFSYSRLANSALIEEICKAYLKNGDIMSI